MDTQQNVASLGGQIGARKLSAKRRRAIASLGGVTTAKAHLKKKRMRKPRQK